LARGADPILFVIGERRDRSQAAILSHDIVETQRRLIEEFEIFDSWSERYETLIDFGRRLQPLPEIMKVDRNRLRSCRGDAWLAGIRCDGLLYLSAASADVLAALLAIVVEVYSGCAPDEILSHPLIVLEATGLLDRLSPHRLASYAEIMARLRDLAH
jgi:cysteine desulfuration protein SufE